MLDTLLALSLFVLVFGVVIGGWAKLVHLEEIREPRLARQHLWLWVAMATVGGVLMTGVCAMPTYTASVYHGWKECPPLYLVGMVGGFMFVLCGICALSVFVERRDSRRAVTQ